MIFVTIPGLLILKNLDEDDRGICRSFFPPMFGEEGTGCEGGSEADRVATHAKYSDLLYEYTKYQKNSANSFDYYNLIEKALLEVEGEQTDRINDQELKKNGITREDLKRIT